jgi:glycosyltransferase involved in cell wall biosynthesis
LLAIGNSPRFDAVLNANASPWKRHDLTLDIDTLAYITYSKTEEGKTFWPLSTKAPAYMNELYLDEVGRQKIYADSCCGLVLSAREGANYTTGELLLSGIPIVSTPSTGGRSFWLTDTNSLICGSTRDEVALAVAQWRRRCGEETVSRERIRSDFVVRMHEQREAFTATLQEALERSGATESAEEIFAALRDRDELLHSLSFKRSETPSLHPYCGGKGWHSLLMLPDSVGNS